MLAECCRLPKNRVPRLRRECALINVGFGWPIHPRAANWVDEPNRDDVRRICVHAVFSGSLVLIQPTLLSHITTTITGLPPATLSSDSARTATPVHCIVIRLLLLDRHCRQPALQMAHCRLRNPIPHAICRRRRRRSYHSRYTERSKAHIGLFGAYVAGHTGLPCHLEWTVFDQIPYFLVPCPVAEVVV